MWTKFSKQLPPNRSSIMVKFGDLRIVKGRVNGSCVDYSPNLKLTPQTITSGQKEWSMVQKKDNRGRAKKPRRKGREAIKDPKMVDPKNRPTKEEIEKKGQGGVAGNMERLVYRMIDQIKSGMSIDSCKTLLEDEINPNTKRVYAPRFVQDISIKANTLIKQDYELQRSEVVSIHTQRYDREIQELLTYQAPYNDRKPWLQDEMNNAARMNCLGVLHQKEELLGMHRKSFKLIINNEDTTVIRTTKTNIDLSKLTLEEKIELNQLMEKSRRTDDEIGGVILRSEQARVIEDVEHEVVEERLNIDRMENKQPKEIIQPHPQDMALLSIQEKMRLALRKKAKEELERVGSKTVEFDNPEHQVPQR